MKRFQVLLIVGMAVCAGLTGCSGAFWSGSGAGVAATGAGYELRAKQQMDKIEGEYKRGEIDKREYDIRKDQIKQNSLAY